MNDTRKTQAMATWEKLFSQPEIRMDAEEQYEALLHLADDFEDQGVLSPQERGRLIEKATALYARSSARQMSSPEPTKSSELKAASLVWTVVLAGRLLPVAKDNNRPEAVGRIQFKSALPLAKVIRHKL